MGYADENDGPPNEGMKLTKSEYREGIWHCWSGIIESDFAAYAQWSADLRSIPHRLGC
jgi:hypothetical protein